MQDMISKRLLSMLIVFAMAFTIVSGIATTTEAASKTLNATINTNSARTRYHNFSITTGKSIWKKTFKTTVTFKNVGKTTINIFNANSGLHVASIAPGQSFEKFPIYGSQQTVPYKMTAGFNQSGKFNLSLQVITSSGSIS